jgi:hypothetical protein
MCGSFTPRGTATQSWPKAARLGAVTPWNGRDTCSKRSEGGATVTRSGGRHDRDEAPEDSGETRERHHAWQVE